MAVMSASRLARFAIFVSASIIRIETATYAGTVLPIRTMIRMATGLIPSSNFAPTGLATNLPTTALSYKRPGDTARVLR